MKPYLELGLDTFGDVTLDADGRPLPQAQVIRDVIDEAVLADELGVDFIGVGEHHRADFAISSPEVVLAAIAGRTSRIRLGSAVTVLSSDDPVRVFQRFATVDAASNGRAEVILGRGSFIESFPLFGYPLDQYETLFEEKLELFAKLLEANRAGTPVTWNGTTRASLEAKRVYPPTANGRLTTWIGVGGSPESVVRAARYRMPLMLAIIGGNPLRFAAYVDLYYRALEQVGAEPLPIGVHSPGHIADTDQQAREELWPAWREMRNRMPLMLAIIGGNPLRFAPYVDLNYRALEQVGAEPLPIGVHSPGHIADTDQQAREELWPAWREMRNRIGAERGWGPTSRLEFDREIEAGSLYVGTPETVAKKIAATSSALGLTRFDMKYSAGTLSHEKMMRSIELYGREVIPRVRELMAAEESELADEAAEVAR